MKSIKEKAEENLEQNKDEILCVYNRYAGFVDGANYVLDVLEKFMKHNLVHSSNIKRLIEQLKK
jgi:hypothetical protein